MKILFTALLLFVFSTPLFSQSQDTIFWSPYHKLKWDDFKGKADSSSPFGATSYPGIKYSLSANKDFFTTKVFCYFLKSKSWVRVISKTGLIHEQGHFDIAELFARRLRKAFSEYNFNYNTIKQDFKNIYFLITKERAAMDSLYDKETDFSQNSQQQLFWNKKLKTELNNLGQYASI